MQGNRLFANLVAVVSVFAWATGFPATKILLETWDAQTIALARLAIGSATLFILLTLTGKIGEVARVNWKDAFLIGGGFLGTATIGIVIAQDLADPVSVVIITTGMPLVSSIIGRINGTEKFQAKILVGISLAIVGGVLAVLAAAKTGPGFRGGEVIVLFTMTMFTLYSRTSVSRFQGLSDMTKAAVTLLAAFLAWFPIVALAAKFGLVNVQYNPTPLNLALLFWMGGVSIGLSMVLWLAAGRILGVTIASIHQNAAPFHVMVIMTLIGSAFIPEQLVAALLVVAGAAMAQWKGKPKDNEKTDANQ